MPCKRSRRSAFTKVSPSMTWTGAAVRPISRMSSSGRSRSPCGGRSFPRTMRTPSSLNRAGGSLPRTTRTLRLSAGSATDCASCFCVPILSRADSICLVAQRVIGSAMEWLPSPIARESIPTELTPCHVVGDSTASTPMVTAAAMTRNNLLDRMRSEPKGLLVRIAGRPGSHNEMVGGTALGQDTCRKLLWILQHDCQAVRERDCSQRCPRESWRGTAKWHDIGE